MTSLQERLFTMQDKQYAAFHAKLTPGGGCVISLWRTLFYVIYCIILEVS